MAKLFGWSLAHALHVRPGCAVVAGVPLGTGLKRHCLAARLAQRTAFASAIFHPESVFELAVQPFLCRNVGRRYPRAKFSLLLLCYSARASSGGERGHNERLLLGEQRFFLPGSVPVDFSWVAWTSCRQARRRLHCVSTTTEESGSLSGTWAQLCYCNLFLLGAGSHPSSLPALRA